MPFQVEDPQKLIRFFRFFEILVADDKSWSDSVQGSLTPCDVTLHSHIHYRLCHSKLDDITRLLPRL